MSKSRPAKTRSKKSVPPATRPAASAKRAARAGADKRERASEREPEIDENTVMCRSCGKRPGRPTAILGQMTQAELCPQCTALRKERIRLNRAAARGMRSSRLF